MYDSPLVEAYNRDGYVIIKDVINGPLLKEFQQHVDFLLKKYPSIPGEHLHHPLMRNDAFWVRLIQDPSLLDLAQLFIGPDIALFSSHYFCKQARTGMPVLWHQDGSYWPIRPMNVVTLWVAADRSDAGNGCLRVVKGSHRTELQELQADGQGQGTNVLGFATHDDESAGALGEIVDVELEPGDVSIHHPNLVHASHANTSDRRRCGLTIRYIPTDVKCFQDDQPVMHFRGDAREGINWYRSWPPYREGVDMEFDGKEAWNERRYKDERDEAVFFSRTDHDNVQREIEEETLAFVAALGGKHA